MGKKILVCPDSFKGSLNAREVAEVMADTLRDIFPDAEIIKMPLADGGEGTAQVVAEKIFPKKKWVEVKDPLGRKIRATYLTDITSSKAFIESASVIGLTLLAPEERNPLVASSRGLGEIINDAIDSGCEEIIVSLGGSATCDGGAGMLEALKGNYEKIKFKALCDVENPLLGVNGAVYVFAPQKGASSDDLPILEKRMEEFLRLSVAGDICNENDAWKSGAGAAGGLGFAFMTYLKAEIISGSDYILQLSRFSEFAEDADLIITGEGKIDRQSMMGKVIDGVLRASRGKGIPVIAIGGIVEDRDYLLSKGLKGLFPISQPHLSLEENMQPVQTAKNLRKIIMEIFGDPSFNLF